MMKQLLATIFFLSFFLNSIAQTKVYFDTDWNETEDVTNAEFYRIAEKKGDLYAIKDFYISGKLQFEGFAKNTKDPLHNEGTCIWYHENGQIAQKINFKDNEIHGDLIQRYSNGNIKTKGFYKNGKVEGVYTEHFPSGDVAYETNYVNGKIDGTYSKYTFEDTLEQRKNYKNGLEHGPYELYRDGKIEYKGSAKNGYKDGLCQEFSTFSGLVVKEYTVVDRKLHGTYIEYDESGPKIIEAVFKEGIPQTYNYTTIRNRNKYVKLHITLTLADGIENWKVFKNDSLMVDSYYKKGIKTKVWKLYNIDKNELVLTADYTNAVCDDGYVQEMPLFKYNFEFSNRFRSIYNFAKIACDNVVFDEIVEDDLAKAIISQYNSGQRRNAQRTDVIESVESAEEEIEETVISSVEESNYPICNKYEDYLTVTLCTQQNENIDYSVFIGLDPKSLKIINEQKKPADHQIFVFFKGSTNYRNNEEKHMYFSIPDTLKKRINKGEIDKEEIIRFLRKDLLDIYGVYDVTLQDALEEELNN